jgi:hypothetical protein
MTFKVWSLSAVITFDLQVRLDAIAIAGGGLSDYDARKARWPL